MKIKISEHFFRHSKLGKVQLASNHSSYEIVEKISLKAGHQVQIIIIKVLSQMRNPKEIRKLITLAVLAMVVTQGFSYIDTVSNAYGLFSPANSNIDKISFNDDRPPQSQDVETTTETNAHFHDVHHSHGVGQTVDAIKKELFNYDSKNAAFTVDENLFTCTSGIYQLLVNSWSNLWDDQGTLNILMGDCGINGLKHAGRIGTYQTATQNAKKNGPKVISDSNNLKTSDETEDDVEIAPTSDSPAQAQKQACEDTTQPKSKTTASNPADEMCFNSYLVAAYLADLDKCQFLETDCLLNAVTSFKKTCQGDTACKQALKAVDPKNPEKSWDSATELDARRTNYHHCKCYKAAVEDALTKLNESRPFTHEVGPHVVSLDNDLLRNTCGINDWDQLCCKIVQKNSSEDGSIQLDWQENKTTHFKGRKLTLVPSGYCTGLATNYNLLNTYVQASQSNTGNNTPNANVGCDGVIQYYNPTASDPNRIDCVTNNPLNYWVATFRQTTNVRSILYIESSGTYDVQYLVGDNPSYLDNPPCIGGQLTAGGWLDCSLSGKYLVLASKTGHFHFMEVMCYSQYFVHHRALSSTLSSTMTSASPYFCTTGTNCQASNVIRTTLVIWNDTPSNTPCCIQSQSQTDPMLQVTIPADLRIELVIITPSDQGTANTELTNWQKNIEVSIVNSSREKQICGTLSDYNLYTEVPCKMVGNQIIVTKPGSSMTLAMAGLSILSNCECSESSLNPALISRAASPLASPSTINTISTGAPISIKLNKQMYDTVSSVCGNADGFTKCGLRTLVFTDKITGFQITFPYKGFELNTDQSELTLNPANATPTSVLTVTVKLGNYPKVTYAQEITAIVEGALHVVQPLRVPTMALNATINQEAFLDLPKLDVYCIYFLVSKQKFEAQVDGNQLKVLSNNETDVGTYNLDLVAVFSSKKVSFEVKVILALPTSIDTKTQTNQILKEGVTPNTTSETQDSKKKGQLAPHKLPKLSISKVNTKGQFYLKFSEPVGLEALNPPSSQLRTLFQGWEPEVRRLKSKGGSRSSSNTGSASNHTLFNFLSAKHLSLTIKSENTTKPVFSWRATNITSTLINIQLEFQDPLYISTSPGVLDKLQIQILPPALMYMISLATGAMTEDALRAVSRKLPPQVILGAKIESVEENTVIFKDVAQSSSLSNIVVQTVLSGSMTQMWSIVNALQIIMSYQFLNLQMPGNVILVTIKLSDITTFKGVLPTDDILKGLFDFTPTDPPGVGFEQMGVDNASVTLYQGITFIIMIFIGLLYLVYGLAYSCRLYDRLMSKIEQKLKPSLFFGLLYLFLKETYLDWAIGSALRLEQPKFDTPSDYFDFGLGCAGILITLVFPCYCFFFLKKNSNKLNNKDFKSKHGALYEGFITDEAGKRSAGMKMAGWFLLRRFLTAVNVIYLRHQTIWIQLTLNMWLTLFDTCVKIHLSPYKSKVGGFMEKFNDFFVLTCAYFTYLFTDLIPSPEDKYFIGWFYDGTVGTLIAANLLVMVKTAFHGIINKIREMILKDKIKKASEARIANRKNQEKMMKLVSQGTGLIRVKPRAISFQNGLNAIHQLSLEQFVAMKSMERKQRREAFLAQTLLREMDDQLAEIPEEDENSENFWSNRAVYNDPDSQIYDLSTKVPHQSHVVSKMVAQLHDLKQTDVNKAAAKLISERVKFESDKKEQTNQVLFKKEHRMSVVNRKLLSDKNKFLQQKEEHKQQPRNYVIFSQEFSSEQKEYQLIRSRQRDQHFIDEKWNKIAVHNQFKDLSPVLNPLDVHVHNWNINDIEQRQRQLAVTGLRSNSLYSPHPDSRQFLNPQAFQSTKDVNLSFRAPKKNPNQERDYLTQDQLKILAKEDAEPQKKRLQQFSANKKGNNFLNSHPEFQQPGETYQQWDERRQKEEEKIQLRNDLRQRAVREIQGQAQLAELGKSNMTTEQAIEKLKQMAQSFR